MENTVYLYRQYCVYHHIEELKEPQKPRNQSPILVEKVESGFNTIFATDIDDLYLKVKSGPFALQMLYIGSIRRIRSLQGRGITLCKSLQDLYQGFWTIKIHLLHMGKFLASISNKSNIQVYPDAMDTLLLFLG